MLEISGIHTGCKGSSMDLDKSALLIYMLCLGVTRWAFSRSMIGKCICAVTLNKFVKYQSGLSEW